MDLRQLKYFVKIVEQRSMSRASVELNVAQSALSLQISGLETRLHQKLLIRRSTGVTPTEAGKTLYKHAVAILRQVERATQDVERSASEVSGPASLGLPVVVQDLLAIDLLVAARTRLPQVRLHLAEGMSYLLKEMVLQGRLDMTVTYQFEPSPGLPKNPSRSSIGQPSQGLPSTTSDETPVVPSDCWQTSDTQRPAPVCRTRSLTSEPAG